MIRASQEGRYSVRVARQYSSARQAGQLSVGVAVDRQSFLHQLAFGLSSLSAAGCDSGGERRLVFRTRSRSRPSRRLPLSDCWACEAGIPRGTVLTDPAYGADVALRTTLTELGLPYVAGVLSTTTVWAPGTGPLPPKLYVPGLGRPTKRLRRDEKHRPVSVKELAFSLPARAWKTITWREGIMCRCDRALLDYAFASPSATSIVASRGRKSAIEWPKGEKEPTKYWLSSTLQTSTFVASLTPPSSGGASSVTILSSSKRSGSDILKAVDGVACIITPRSLDCSRFILVSEGKRFPPQDLVPPHRSKIRLSQKLPTQMLRHLGSNGTSQTRSQRCDDA